MLPLGAQGACQAIEDAGALHALLDSSITAADVPTRLVMYEMVRRLRASRTQTLSNVRLGREKDVYEKLRRYADPPGSGKRLLPLAVSLSECIHQADSRCSLAVPTSFAERFAHDYG